MIELVFAAALAHSTVDPYLLTPRPLAEVPPPVTNWAPQVPRDTIINRWCPPGLPGPCIKEPRND